MRARYYNVDIKRFVNQDVLTGTLERISSLNRYAYVEGNPVSFLDPFGLAIEILDFISTMVGMLTILTFIAPEVTIIVNTVIYAINLTLDVIQVVRYGGDSERYRELLKDTVLGAINCLAPFGVESNIEIVRKICNGVQHELTTLVNTFIYIFSLEET